MLNGMRLAAAAVAGYVAVLEGSALVNATGLIECIALDGAEVSVALTLGASPITPVMHVRAQIGQLSWSTAPEGEGQRWLLAQGFLDERWLAVDLLDEQALRRLASLRVLHAEEGRELHRYGYLQLHGEAVHPVRCIGP